MSKWQPLLATVLKYAGRTAAGLAMLWAFGAIFFDAPFPRAVKLLLALLWLGLLFFLRFRMPTHRFRRWLVPVFFLVVYLPWLTKEASDQRDWVPEQAHAPQITIDGDVVTIQHYRNFDYQEDGTPIERWETRQFRLSKLEHMDFFVSYWGSQLIAHTFFSFDFGEDGHVVFSIESRREKGESYGVISGLYKQFELIYAVGSESDIVRVRSHIRPEQVGMYRLKIEETTVHLRFAEYVDSVNHFHRQPAWYNVITANCITAVRGQLTTAERHALDWRIICNGKLDTKFHEIGILEPGLPFAKLKEQSWIRPETVTDLSEAGYSRAIRHRRPGFTRKNSPDPAATPIP